MKILISLVIFFVAVLFIAPGSVSANDSKNVHMSPADTNQSMRMQKKQGSRMHQNMENKNELAHAYKPVARHDTKEVQARVNNNTNSTQHRLVCVEGFNSSNKMSTHLGCLQVHLDPMNSQGMWAMEFNTPTNNLKPGNYTIVYTYQDEEGMWHHIKSMNMQVWDGQYQAR